MEQNLDALNSLTNSVRLLMSKCTQLETQNKELSLQLVSLNNEVLTKQTELDDLSEQYKVLRMAKSLEGSSSENKEVKLKINEMVREIDKCIALLNK